METKTAEEMLNEYVPCDCYKRLRLKDQCKVCKNHSILIDCLDAYASQQTESLRMKVASLELKISKKDEYSKALQDAGYEIQGQLKEAREELEQGRLMYATKYTECENLQQQNKELQKRLEG